MRHFGIIGYPLVQSFSARYFNEKFEREHIDAEYSLYPIDKDEWGKGSKIKELLLRMDGMNVTMPYKQDICPFLDQLDETAKNVGAVNVVYQKTGYNTDCVGFMRSIQPLLLPTDHQALVLGTGGASKAVKYGLEQLGLTVQLVSRTPQKGVIGYNDLTEEIMRTHSVIVNATPLGMFPDINSCAPIPYELIDKNHLLFDCVYNPELTVFLSRGQAQGARIQNGLGMLYGQAEEAWRIWSGTSNNM